MGSKKPPAPAAPAMMAIGRSVVELFGWRAEESVLGYVVRVEVIVTDVLSVGVLFVFSVAADVLSCRVVILVGLPLVKEVTVIGPIVHDPPIPGNLIEVILD